MATLGAGGQEEGWMPGRRRWPGVCSVSRHDTHALYVVCVSVLEEKVKDTGIHKAPVR